MSRHRFLPSTTGGIEAYCRLARHTGTRLHYACFKRGYMAGYFGKGRGFDEGGCPFRDGMLRWHWCQGWRVGRDAKSDMKPKPPTPPGGRRKRIPFRLTA